jgi:hypothetical protein
MSQQRSDENPTSASTPEAKSKRPTATELSPKELDQVAGGVHDLNITKKIDKSSAKLFIG